LMPNLQSLAGVIRAKPKEFQLLGYNPMESIKAPMAV